MAYRVYMMGCCRWESVGLDLGHKGGLSNLRPRRERCRASFSNTGGPPRVLKEGAIPEKLPRCD